MRPRASAELCLSDTDMRFYLESDLNCGLDDVDDTVQQGGHSREATANAGAAHYVSRPPPACTWQLHVCVRVAGWHAGHAHLTCAWTSRKGESVVVSSVNTQQQPVLSLDS